MQRELQDILNRMSEIHQWLLADLADVQKRVEMIERQMEEHAALLRTREEQSAIKRKLNELSEGV